MLHWLEWCVAPVCKNFVVEKPDRQMVPNNRDNDGSINFETVFRTRKSGRTGSKHTVKKTVRDLNENRKYHKFRRIWNILK